MMRNWNQYPLSLMTYVRRIPSRTAAWMGGCVLLAAAQPSFAQDFYPPPLAGDDCPILDAPFESWVGARAGYVFPAESGQKTPRDVSAIEAAAWGRLFYLENDLGADVEGRAHVDWTLMREFGLRGDDYAITAARLVFQASFRFVGGWGLRLHADPGVYADGTPSGGGMWAVRGGAVMTKALSSHFAFQAGVGLRPGTDRVVDPKVGLVWAPGPRVRLEIAYPESELSVYAAHRLKLFAGARYRNQEEFDTDEDDLGNLRWSEGRIWAGTEVRLGSTHGIRLEAGGIFARSFTYDDPDYDVEPGRAMYVQVGWAGLF